MSCSLYRWTEECNGQPCPGDCDVCDRNKIDLFDFIKAIPKVLDRGVEHTGVCPCGGTIKAIRSVNSGHLSAKCDGCGRRVME